MIAKRLDLFRNYPFAEIDNAKTIAQSRGVRVIDFGIGDPESIPDRKIIKYLKDSIDIDEPFRYPSYEGEEILRKSFCDFFERRYGVNLDYNKECIVLIGSKEGIAHLPLAILNPNEIVSMPDPGYPVYKAGVVFAGGCSHKYPLKEENDWLPDFKRINIKAKLFYINYPSNPTGAIAPIEFFENAVKYAKKYKMILVNDAAYNEIYFKSKPVSVLQIKGAKDFSVEFHSASKTFCVPGFRIGFLVGNSKIISAMAILKKNIDSGQFSPIQYALSNCYDNYETIIKKVHSLYDKRRKTFYRLLKDTPFEPILPEATFYIWKRIPSKFNTTSSKQFVASLIEKSGIIAMPGVSMGEYGENYIRFSLTLPYGDLIEGCERLKNFNF